MKKYTISIQKSSQQQNGNNMFAKIVIEYHKRKIFIVLWSGFLEVQFISFEEDHQRCVVVERDET